VDPEEPRGLSAELATARLQAEGPNELPAARPRQWGAILVDVLREPMLLLLTATGAIYLVLGDLQEALVLIASIGFIIGLTFYQAQKTERALERLRDLSSPRALVIRDGERRRIAGRDVVRGDVVLLAEGDRVPADGVLLTSAHLAVDESLLTGEAVPVRKLSGDRLRELGRPGGDDLPFVYSGTLVVRGHGMAEVLATGARTELGKIGKALQTLEPEVTRLQRDTGRIVRVIAAVAIALSLLVAVVYGLTRGVWLDGLLVGLTLAMAIIPEEFPLVLTVFLALGAWRLARSQVLTRRVPSVETLGSATVLCVDKTGTLTFNRLAVQKLWAAGQFYAVPAAATALPDAFHELVEFGILASQREPFDPVDRAFKALGDRALARTEHLHADWTLIREYPLSPALLALSHVWRAPAGDRYVIAAKGAPEAIGALCHLNPADTAALSRAVAALADDGLRVLGVARAYFQGDPLPGDQHDFAFELLGLVALADPIRPSVPPAIRECHAAGVRVVMITGDYPGTARQIARQIGLEPLDAILTGADLETMDDAELRRRVRTTNIFARVVPEQKLRLVTALKTNGEVVAMTGDGVNDAPALKAAHIGIAMGDRGTDVAREAAALVLLDDDFASIVRAIRQGRRIFDNLQKAMGYLFAVHVPIAGMSLLPVLFQWPLVLLPVHVVFLELIIDPACSVVFEAEPEEADVMRRPPRDLHEPLFDGRTIALCLLQGAVVLLVVLAVYLLTLYRDQGEDQARALAFATLIVGNLGLILTNRSWSRPILATLRAPNAALAWVLAGALLALGLVLYVPFLRSLFHFALLHPADLAICLVGGAFSIVWFEALKLGGGRLGWAPAGRAVSKSDGGETEAAEERRGVAGEVLAGGGDVGAFPEVQEGDGQIAEGG
jgi:Ca2+-transporting ATPase